MYLTKDLALQFTKDSIKKSNRPNYPFRSRYRHTLRVLMWVERLQKVLGGDLEVLTYSAIFHDCSWNGQENHSITSYKAAKDFLIGFKLDKEFREKVLEGVRYHNENDTSGLCKESYILMDADELDEVGALCIVWDTLAEQHQHNTPTYNTVLDRIKKYLPDLHKNIEKFNFDYSTTIYKRKLKFMEQFVKEAEEELND